jgi:hypothetical protein
MPSYRDCAFLLALQHVGRMIASIGQRPVSPTRRSENEKNGMKTHFRVLLTLLPVLAQPAAVQAQFNFRTNTDNTITITKYTGSGAVVNIPSSTNGYPITAIGTNAFQNSGALKSLTTTNNVSDIGDWAFASCSHLTNVTLGGSINSIGSNTFVNAYALRRIAIPDTVTNIGSGAFANSALANVTIGNGVRTIGKGAFNNCTSLTSVTIPNGVTQLSDVMFFNCYNLTYVSIPDSVTSVGYGVFQDCTLLYNITIPDSVTNIGGQAFWSSGLRSITVPDSVITIGAQAFGSCGLRSVTLGKGVTSIPDQAFSECGNLTDVTIPDGVTGIGAGAFWECTGLVNLTMPASVTNIFNGAFEACSGLSGVYFMGEPPSLFGANWFYEDSNVTVYYLPGTTNWGATFGGVPTMLGTPEVPCGLAVHDGTLSIAKYTGSGGAAIIPGTIAGLPVTSIGNAAFQSCSNLASVTIPGSVTNLEDYAFASCSMLSGIYFQSNAPNLGAGVFSNVAATVYHLPGTTGWDTNYGGLATMLGTSEVPCSLALDNGTLSIAKYTGFGGPANIPGTIAGLPVTSIGGSAFQSCSNLTSVTIPGSITNIGALAFDSCTSLTNVTIANGVVSIGDQAFSRCLKLPSIAIPATVTDIGSLAFYSCTNLTTINVDAANPVYSSVSGLLFDKGHGTLIQCPGRVAGSCTIPNTVTNLEDYAFASCYALTGIYFQSNAPSLGTGVFSNASATVFYMPWTAGWSSTFGGLRTLAWNPQDLVQNGGFETGDFSCWVLAGQTTNSSGWMFNVVESATTGWGVTRSGGYGAFLGDTQVATLSQTLGTVPGQSYLLSLWLQNSTSGSTQRFGVNWNTNSVSTNTVFSILNPPAFSWTNLQFLVTATSTNTTLQIQAENDPHYFGLDDVHAVSVPVPVLATPAIWTNSISLSWDTTPGIMYQVQYRTNLSQSDWIALTGSFMATNSTAVVVDTNALASDNQRFYRLSLGLP